MLAKNSDAQGATDSSKNGAPVADDELNQKSTDSSSKDNTEAAKPTGGNKKSFDDFLSRLPGPIPRDEYDVRYERYKTRQALIALHDKKVSAELRRKNFILVFFYFVLFSTVIALIFASINNPDVYEVDTETLRYLNRFFNASILLIMPFVLGMIGAFTRVLISGLKAEEHIGLLAASGLISTFSWVGIKSGVLMQLVAPHLASNGIESVQSHSFENQFYTMVLVALIVGMFSSNVYIFVNERIELILSKKNANSSE